MGKHGMLLNYGLLLDFVFSSVRISACVLVCGHMLTQLGFYHLALFYHAADLMGTLLGALTFFGMVMQMYDGHRYGHDVEAIVRTELMRRMEQTETIVMTIRWRRWGRRR